MMVFTAESPPPHGSSSPQAFYSVAPGKGKRAHISLKGWFGGGVTEIFCSDEGVIAVEPEQSSIGKRVDHSAMIMRELVGIREVIDKNSNPRRDPEATSLFTSSDNDECFIRRQEGMLDTSGNNLSRLKIRSVNRRQTSVWSISSGGMQEWQRKAREVEAKAHSRRGVIKAQALIRGYMLRSKKTARFPSEDT